MINDWKREPSKGLMNYLLGEGKGPDSNGSCQPGTPGTSLAGVVSPSMSPVSSKEGPQPPQTVLGQRQW